MAPISPFSTENAECGQIQVEGATPGHAPLPQVEFISALRKLSFCCSFLTVMLLMFVSTVVSV
jgi:hypothetical protein